MKISLKTKLILSFSGIILFTGLVTAFVGSTLIREGVIRQVQEKVRTDLTAAGGIWDNRIESIEKIIHYATFRSGLKEALLSEDRGTLGKYLNEIRAVGDIEMLTITDSEGKVVLRSSNPGKFGDSQSGDQLIGKVLSERRTLASPLIVAREELEKEGRQFADRAQIKLVDTPKAKPGAALEETSGLVLKAAAPIRDDQGKLIGVLYGGDLVNRNYSLVDKIKDTVYLGEQYQGMDMGTSTIFQGDLRISTNVLTEGGERAIGTRVSAEVHEKVFEQGAKWIDRAFVVNAWYITAYEPIRDIDENIIGILYVGLLEKKFVDIEYRTILIFFGITVLCMTIALIAANILSNTIIRPIESVVKMSRKISSGDFSVKFDVKRTDELGLLKKAYNKMATDLCERDEKINTTMAKLEQLSRTDDLTGIMNRRAFTEFCMTEIGRARRFENPFSVAYIDLDNFKVVNDKFGHSTGDELLCSVAETIQKNIREIDLFARLGGDEFMLLLVKSDSEASLEVVKKLQNMLMDVMNKNGWPVTFSIGLVTYNLPPDEVEEIIRNTDELMYAAKQSGKNTIMCKVLN
jgi:two-component system, NtrC family, sensor kinase